MKAIIDILTPKQNMFFPRLRALRPYYCWSACIFTITLSSMFGLPRGPLLWWRGWMMGLKASQSMRESILASLSPSF